MPARHTSVGPSHAGRVDMRKRAVRGWTRSDSLIDGAQMDHRLLGARRQGHAALCVVAHEFSLLIRGAHAHTSLGSSETLPVVDVTIGSATPRRLSCC